MKSFNSLLKSFAVSTITAASIAHAQTPNQTIIRYGLADAKVSGVTFQIGYSAGVHDGTVSTILAGVTLDEKNQILAGDFIVPIASMSTGNATRDCHMREALGIDYNNNNAKGSKFPAEHVCDSNNQTPKVGPDAIVFDRIKFSFRTVKANSNSVLPAVMEVGKVYKLAVQGQWTMHGIVQDISLPTSTEFVPVEVKLLNATTKEIQVSGKFELSLKKFNVIVKPFKFGPINITVADNAKITLNSKLAIIK